VLDCGDDTADERFSGLRGLVTGLLYDDPRVQAPHSPLIVVWVEGLGEEVFFPEELKRVARQVNAVRAMLAA
jgi:CarS bacterial SH3 domain